MAPLVGIIMGSDSDLSVMKGASDILKEFGIPFELTVVSAHRTPLRMVEYAQQAAGRGLKVIIAGAGGYSFFKRKHFLGLKGKWENEQ